MQLKSIKFILYSFCLVLAFLLFSCSFHGDVYVAFFWANDAIDMPNAVGSDFSAIPGVPAVAGITEGGYYLTLPGTYTFDYVALGGGSYTNESITMQAASSLGGVETSYYNIVLNSAAGVTIQKLP